MAGESQPAADPAIETTERAGEEPLDDSRINSAVQSKVFASEGLTIDPTWRARLDP